jgi:UPF0042 nucleotide-binding protein
VAERLHIIVVTGLAGSGKSHCIHALEDSGFYCIDNLPVELIPRFVALCRGYGDGIRRIALGIDLREGRFLSSWPSVLAELKAAGHRVDVLFLDASNEVLMRRFNETRRPHPLAAGGSVEEGIVRERSALADMRALADNVIDTSGLNVHELKAEIEAYIGAGAAGRKMNLFLNSFGYKFGVPHDADVIFDVRFLPNPYFIDVLSGKSGLDAEVRDFVIGREETRLFLQRFCSLLEFVLPRYEKEGKSHLTLALGCTGGRHRSVVLVEELKKKLTGKGLAIRVKHRDIHR